MVTVRTACGLVLLAVIATVGCGSDPATTPGRIVYQREVGGHWQLFTIDPDGSGQRQITALPGDAVAPEWSPDGKRIVFEHDLPGEAGCVVMLVDADGGNPIDIPGSRGCDNNPSFTPDGRRVVFVRYDQKRDRESIVSTDLAGADPRVITGTNNDTDPNVSPDGKTLTFLRIKEDDKLQALFAADIDGQHLRRLTPYTDNVARKHAWSPDGTRILITVNADWAKRGESSNIVSIRPDGSDRQRLTRFTGGQVKGAMRSRAPTPPTASTS
jgi:Tol biopolymer transport system component